MSRVYGRRTSVAQAGFQQGPAGTPLAESKLRSHLMLQEHGSLRPKCSGFPHSTVGLVADRSAPPPWRARLVLATAPLTAGRLVFPPRLHPASGRAVESGLGVNSSAPPKD